LPRDFSFLYIEAGTRGDLGLLPFSGMSLKMDRFH